MNDSRTRNETARDTDPVRNESEFQAKLNAIVPEVAVLVAAQLALRPAGTDLGIELRDRKVRYRGDFEAFEFRFSAGTDRGAIFNVGLDPESSDRYRVTPGACLPMDWKGNPTTAQASAELVLEAVKDYQRQVLAHDPEMN